MTLALAILGYVLVLAGIVVIVCFSGIAVMTAFSDVVESHDRRVEELERRRMSERMLTLSWWFSEDKLTMALLNDIADSYRRGIYPIDNVDEIRDRWRATRKANPLRVAGC